MNIYELRKAVEGRLIRSLTEQEWKDYGPDDYVGTYDEYDTDEVVKALPRSLLIKRQYRANIPLGSLVIREWAKALTEQIPIIRQQFGLSGPIPVEQVESLFKKFLREDGDDWLACPSYIECNTHHTIFHTRLIRVDDSDPALVDFKWLIDHLAEAYQYPASLIVAFIFCDIPITYDHVTVEIVRNQVKLHILGPVVSVRQITDAYRSARTYYEKTYGKFARKTTKNSDRVLSLDIFIRKTPGLSWVERLHDWNQKYPRWAYKDNNSMQVVFSRIRKVREKARRELRADLLS